ncbi:hypothetical protein TRVA0_010S02894 [Trichomonascus vanleenenianus]|uniref:uncharacterized protein n=1 Tax=Trichomonascus vanleenenianus TaxID=2268995 RepID=UPI003EC97535
MFPGKLFKGAQRVLGDSHGKGSRKEKGKHTKSASSKDLTKYAKIQATELAQAKSASAVDLSRRPKESTPSVSSRHSSFEALLPGKLPRTDSAVFLHKLRKNKRIGSTEHIQLAELPDRALQSIMSYLEYPQVLELQTMCRAFHAAAITRTWNELSISNVATHPPRTRAGFAQHVNVHRHKFRHFFEDVFVGKCDEQLAEVKKLSLNFQEHEPLSLTPTTNPETARNLNYVPFEHFIRWFIAKKAPTIMRSLTEIELSVSVMSDSYIAAVQALCWAFPRATVTLNLWIQGVFDTPVSRMITPNMRAVEIKCDVVFLDMKRTFGAIRVPRHCEQFRLLILDNLRHKYAPGRLYDKPIISAETLQAWFQHASCLKVIELQRLEIVNRNSIDWTQPALPEISQKAQSVYDHQRAPSMPVSPPGSPGASRFDRGAMSLPVTPDRDISTLILREVEFSPRRWAVPIKGVTYLVRENVHTRPLQEIITPNIRSVKIAATKATPEQIEQLRAWIGFHSIFLQKISLECMPYRALKSLLQGARDSGCPMMDIISPIDDGSRFADLATECSDFKVLKVDLGAIPVGEAQEFVRRAVASNNSLHSLRLVDGPISPGSMPFWLANESFQIQFIRSNPTTARQELVYEKPIQMYSTMPMSRGPSRAGSPVHR